MEHARLDAWLESYRRAWDEADTPAVLGLFTTDATYRSHPLRPAHVGHDGIATYWNRATADQRNVRVRLGDPIVDGDRVAVEWWTTMHAGDTPVTLVGCLFLTFAADGRCLALRECWNLTEALHDPPPDWGQLTPAAAQPPGEPATGDPARAHARRWAEGYERAWRAGDPGAAAALYALGTHYRSEPFRRPAPGSRGRARLHPQRLRHRSRPGPPVRHPVRLRLRGRGRVVDDPAGG
jgi:hypothetical protein